MDKTARRLFDGVSMVRQAQALMYVPFFPQPQNNASCHFMYVVVSFDQSFDSLTSLCAFAPKRKIMVLVMQAIDNPTRLIHPLRKMGCRHLMCVLLASLHLATSSPLV